MQGPGDGEPEILIPLHLLAELRHQVIHGAESEPFPLALLYDLPILQWRDDALGAWGWGLRRGQ